MPDAKHKLVVCLFWNQEQGAQEEKVILKYIYFIGDVLHLAINNTTKVFLSKCDNDANFQLSSCVNHFATLWKGHDTQNWLNPKMEARRTSGKK